VGAGPGRPDLITLRGVQCLAVADAVMIDALVDRRLLRHCRPDVKVLNAGKRGHGPRIEQPDINRLLLRLARAGKTVVRLKGGDPYFFGRGGEEAAFLRRHKIPFEVVPGVSSVTAVPGYAGIPLTDRRHTSMVTVITGHSQTETEDAVKTPGVDWKSLTPGRTLVILMGVSRLPFIVDNLRAAGWPKSTPAAVVQWGTFPFQRCIDGTLADIAWRVRRAGLGAPAVIVVGAVAALRDELNWYERLPLFGRTVLVTRTQEQSSGLARLLEEAGAYVLESPVIRPRAFPLGHRGKKFLRALAAGAYDGVLFTSANAARFFLEHWKRFGKAWPAKTVVSAVGPKTAETLAAGGVRVRVVAREFVAEGLARRLGGAKGKTFLLPRAAAARDVLPAAVRKRGGRADVWPLYETLPEKLAPDIRARLLSGGVDAVTFTSSSTVTHLLAQVPAARRKKIFRKTAAASIGPVTTAALRSAGLRPAVVARRATVEDLAGALIRHFSKESRS